MTIQMVRKRLAAGESVVITKRGKPIVRILRLNAERQRIDARALRAVTDQQETTPADSAAFLRTLREDSRY